MYAITARIVTVAAKETVIDIKLIPMGDNPKNKPISPVKPKLKETDNTRFSIKSSRFLPKKSMSTRQ